MCETGCVWVPEMADLADYATLQLMGEDFELRRDPVGLQDGGLLFVLTVGFWRNSRVVGRLYAEMAVGLIETADAVRLIVDVARDVLDVLHVCPERTTESFKLHRQVLRRCTQSATDSGQLTIATIETVSFCRGLKLNSQLDERSPDKKVSQVRKLTMCNIFHCRERERERKGGYDKTTQCASTDEHKGALLFPVLLTSQGPLA